MGPSSPSRHRTAWTRRPADGQSLVIFSVFSLALIGMIALAIDGGFLLAERRQAQSAADAAALAAATAALDKRPSDEVTATGITYGTFNARVASSNVVISRPPTSGDHAGDNMYVQATVTKTVSKYFLGAIYSGSWQVTARAVAGIEPVKKPYALVALRDPGIDIPGSGTITIGGGGSIMSNSDITSSGTSNVVTVGGSIDASGTIEEQPGWTAQDGINENVNPVTDPLAGTTPPPVPSPTITNAQISALDCSSACTLPAGYYNNLGNININGVATLESNRIYYFDGNTRIRLIGENAWLKGSGVLLYFTGDARIDPGTANIQLSAASSPLYPGGVAGIVFWIANCTTFDSQGNGIFSVEGVIYAPCSHVELHGTPGSNGVQVIVGDLQLNGTSDFTIEYREWIKFDVPKVWLVE